MSEIETAVENGFYIDYVFTEVGGVVNVGCGKVGKIENSEWHTGDILTSGLVSYPYKGSTLFVGDIKKNKEGCVHQISIYGDKCMSVSKLLAPYDPENHRGLRIVYEKDDRNRYILNDAKLIEVSALSSRDPIDEIPGWQISFKLHYNDLPHEWYGKYDFENLPPEPLGDGDVHYCQMLVGGVWITFPS